MELLITVGAARSVPRKRRPESTSAASAAALPDYPIHLRLFVFHSGDDGSAGEAGGDLVAKLDLGCVFDQMAGGIEYQGIAAIENFQRGELLETRGDTLEGAAPRQEKGANGSSQGGGVRVNFASHATKLAAYIEVADAGAGNIETTAVLA